MRRIDARRKNAKAFRLRHSQSLAKRRQRLSHAVVRSTIHRLGKTAKPFAISERLTISRSILPEDFAKGRLKDRPLIAAVGIELQGRGAASLEYRLGWFSFVHIGVPSNSDRLP